MFLVDTNILLLGAYVLGSALFDHGVTALPEAATWLAALLVAVLLHEMGHAGVAAAFKIPSKQIVLTFFGGYVEFAMPPKAGPLSNLATYGLLLAFSEPIDAAPDLVFRFFHNLLFASFILGAFNLLPGYPLDGGAILRSVLNYFMKRGLARMVAAFLGLNAWAEIGRARAALAAPPDQGVGSTTSNA